MELLTMAAQMALCCMVIALGAFGAMWAVFRAADMWGQRGHK